MNIDVDGLTYFPKTKRLSKFNTQEVLEVRSTSRNHRSQQRNQVKFRELEGNHDEDQNILLYSDDLCLFLGKFLCLGL